MEELNEEILRRFLYQTEIDQIKVQRKTKFGKVEALLRDGIPQIISIREKNIKLPLTDKI